MNQEKYSTSRIAGIVDSEGLDYAIQCYLNPDKIEDPKLAELWVKASDVLSEIEKILSSSIEEEQTEETETETE